MDAVSQDRKEDVKELEEHSVGQHLFEADSHTKGDSQERCGDPQLTLSMRTLSLQDSTGETFVDKTMVKVYYPLPGELIAVGVVGILLYGLVFCFAVYSLRRSVQGVASKLFFALLIVMAVLEIPRFAEIVSTASYASEAAYALHILAGSVFFGAFGVVCYEWGKLLEVGSMSKAVLSINALVIAVAVFTIIDIVALALCFASTNLRRFFASEEFVALTVIEAVKNSVYSTILTISGVRLVRKLWRYSREERQRTSVFAAIQHNILWRRQQPVAQHSSDEEELKEMDPDTVGTEIASPRHRGRSYSGPGEAVMLGVVVRITWAMVLTSVCFALRICMLVVKVVALYSVHPVTTPAFSMFGFLWMVLADFIPRVVPSLAFMMLMQHRGGDSADQQQQRPQGVDQDWTLVRRVGSASPSRFQGRSGTVTSPAQLPPVLIHAGSAELSDVTLE